MGETSANPDLVVGDDGRARPLWAASDPLLRTYYDTEWGLPVTDERGVFERLSLEGFQAGLSWVLILKRREAFRDVFANFDVDAVSAFGAPDVERALADPRIVRNRRKVEAVVRNARAAVELRPDGGLANLVWDYRPDEALVPLRASDIPASTPESVALAKELKNRGFTFVGPTTVYALMQAIGIVNAHLVGSHRRPTADATTGRAG